MTSRAIIEYEKNAANYMFGEMAGIDASLWSVSAFSLKISDYEEIKKTAFGFAYSLKYSGGVKEGEFGAYIGGAPAFSQELGIFKIKLDQGGLSMDENFLGYSNGFSEGVNYYFSRMP